MDNGKYIIILLLLIAIIFEKVWLRELRSSLDLGFLDLAHSLDLEH